MGKTFARKFLPVELVFNPNWWYQTAGISFNEPFYLDPEERVKNDITMRRLLFQRFGDMGMGEEHPESRGVIGSPYVAGGFIVPALLGAKIRFSPNAAPQPEPMMMTGRDIEIFEKPDFSTQWPMREIITQMDDLEEAGKSIIGDLNTDGLLNCAYHLYDQGLFMDFTDAPGRARRLLEIIGELISDVASYIRSRTGSCSISVNRMIEQVNPSIFLHANCSVQMISPGSYRQIQLPIEKKMASRMAPFGIHHCGGKMQNLAEAYSETGSVFYDVGWGSDIAQCRRKLPDAFFNLRLSPVRMLQCSPAEISADTEYLLNAASPLEQAGICCINMDYGTPDENIFAMYVVIEKYRKYGA
jgi:hypothetical protein